jgi:uncharacterized protein YeaO (DUF488 family)
MIQIKRAYEPFQKKDGYRVLVDRLWPRGIRKADLAFDAWLKELAPSNELRRSFAHDPRRWATFRQRYRAELRSAEQRDRLADLAKRGAKGTVTLLYSAKDTDHNNAVVLKSVLDRKRGKRPPARKPKPR